MLLSRLLEETETRIAQPDVEIRSVTEVLERVRQGSLFVAVRGRRTDGHRLIPQAFARGAEAAIVSADSVYAEADRCYGTLAPREALARCNQLLYGHPEQRLRIVAVTGTCGKSTVAHLTAFLLQKCGARAGLIGTVSCFDGAAERPSIHTTPGPEELYPLMARMVQNGCRYCVMEASSQAITQARVFGLLPAVGVFTNFGQDHLDVHGSLQAYFEAKCSLLFFCEQVLLGVDSPAVLQLSKQLRQPFRTFGFSNGTDYHADCFLAGKDGVSFRLSAGAQNRRVTMPMPGQFSAENALTAIGICDLLGFPPAETAEKVADYRPLKGRLEWVAEHNGVRVMIDFAHTPDSLRAVLTALRPICSGRILLVFGCGGDRDRDKRPKMARVATELADVIFLTDDNPRTERPEQIFGDLLTLLKAGKTPFNVIRPREDAILSALDAAEDGDLVLLAGKGHETVQIVGRETRMLDEAALVRAYYEKRDAQKI